MGKKENTLQNKILKLAKIYVDLSKKSDSSQKFSFSDEDIDKFNKIYEEILSNLLNKPGMLLFFEDPNDQKIAKIVIDIIYENIDSDEIFDEMTGGGFSGLLVNILSDYIDRAKLLKPTFISLNPENEEFKRYFEEAMHAWLSGADRAALILCASIIEDILKNKLDKIDIDLAYDLIIQDGQIKGIKSIGLKKLIQNALNENIFSFEDYKKALNIVRLRNEIVHELKDVNFKETYNAIIDTKNLVEKLFSQKIY